MVLLQGFFKWSVAGMKKIASSFWLMGALSLAIQLAGCSSIWPFGGGSGERISRVPANATEYQCEGGKRFYMRYLDNGASAWIIFPEREFRLDKVASASGTRYANASAVLDVAGNEVSLTDGPTAVFKGCKVPSGEK